MATKYISYYPNTLEGQALLDIFGMLGMSLF